MEEKVPITIVYLGKRGGGAKITSQIFQDLKVSKMFSVSAICIRNDNELVREYEPSRLVPLFDNLFSFKTLLKVFQYAVLPKKLLTDTRIEPSGFCVIPMISPLGLLIECLLKIQGVNIIRLLHDFEKHPGEKWPPNILIRYIVKRSNFLIALSNDVAVKIRNFNQNIKVAVYPHPTFDFSNSLDSVKDVGQYVLFIGRIRKYKGVKNLIAAFSKLQEKNFELLIAGEGNYKFKSYPRIRVINRWLAENEIVSLIKNAEVVIFPYIEASQSGLLPYCVSVNKKVVITPLPGLLEQTESYKNAFITENFDVNSLRFAIDVAITAETSTINFKVPERKNIETSLLESGLFVTN